MNKKNFVFLMIFLSFTLIILNFIFTSDQMDMGFWLRTAGAALVFFAMVIAARALKKNEKK